MTINNGYATLAEIKAAQTISSVNAGDDAYIEDLVEAASRYIDIYTGRRFWANSVDETRTYHADEIDMLMIDDCLSITTLKTDQDGDHVYETTWNTTDYDLMPSNAPLYPRPYTWIKVAPYGFYPFPPWGLGVQIVGKSDYPADMPSDASKMFGCNVLNLLKIMVDKDGNLMLNMMDEIIHGTTAVHGKEYISQRVKQMLNIK